MSKRGMSTLVASLILVTLCLVALVFVGITIKNSFKDDSNQLEVDQFTLDLEISQVQILNETDVEVTLKRNSKENELSGAAFVFYDEDDNEISRQNVSIKELEDKNFSVVLKVVNSTLIEKISIAPIFKKRFGKDVLGEIQDKKPISYGGGGSGGSSSRWSCSSSSGGTSIGHLTSSAYPEGSEYGYWRDHLRWILSLGINDVGEYVGGDFAHGLNHVTEQEETVAEHPEYYAIWGGNLMNGLEGNDMKQDLCSEELLQATIRYVKDMIDIYNISTVGIWPVDGFSRVSESSQECLDMATPERGKDGLISDYVWDFMNTVAWAIHDDSEYGPDKMIQCGAYPSYQLLPLNLSDSRGMAPNIVVVLTKHRSQTADSELKQHYQDLTEEWLEILPSKTVYTWDYYLQNHAGRSNIANYPAFYPHIIDEDLKYLKGKTKGEFIEVYSNWPFDGYEWDTFVAQSLNIYVTTRLYWDVDQDVDTLLNEYYNLYYGPAKNEMKKVIEYAEKNLPYAAENPLLLTNMRERIKEALVIANADPNPLYAKRIEILLNLINAYYEGEEIFIDACQNLTSPATTYKLTRDVDSESSCFLLDGDGITLDCQGHTITYSLAGGLGDYAIIVNEGRPTNTYRGDYFKIKNCIIQDGSYLSGNTTGSAIYLKEADHGEILDVFINTSGYGITGLGVNITCRNNEVHTYEGVGYLTQYGDRNIAGPVSNNFFENNYFGSIENYGARFYQNKNDTLINNTFYSKNNVGLHNYAIANMTYINNKFISDSTVGFRVYGTSSFTLFEGNIQIDGL
jgi:hypothetical protein